MRCLAVCQDELVIRMLDEILLPGFEVEFIVENRPLARRLHDAGVTVTVGDPAPHRHLPQGRHRPQHLRHHRRQRQAQPARRSSRRSATPAARWSTSSASAPRRPRKRAEEFHAEFPDVAYLSMSELFGGPLLTEFSRSLTRARVQQYQRYLQRRRSRADHAAQRSRSRRDGQRPGAAQRPAPHQDDGDHRRDPGRDAARRTCGWSTCSTSTSRRSPPESLKEYDRIAMVDVQPHYFGGLIDRVDLVIDHHPEQPGYTAVFKDIRADYGSTSTILTEHLRAVDVEHLGAHRHRDALRDQVGHAVLQPPDQPRRPRGVLVSLSARRRGADPQDGRRGNHARAARLRDEGAPAAARWPTRCSARSSAPSPREDFIPYVADFFLQLEDVKWTVIAGIVNDSLVVSVRNLGYSKNAGEFVRRFFADIGSAGGHRAMAKAVVPMRAFREKFGDLDGDDIEREAAGAASREFLRTSRRAHEKEARAEAEVKKLKSADFADFDFRLQPSTSERLIEIGDQIGGVFEADRQPQHPPGHAGCAQLLVGVPPLRREHRQADQALDAAEAGRALDDLQPIVDALGAIVAAVQIEADHAAEARSSAAARSRDRDATAGPGSRPG